MDAKQKRGMEIAASRRIKRTGKSYTVPSLAGVGTYKVDISSEPPTCTCPENRLHGVKCAHIYAAGYFRVREEGATQPLLADTIKPPEEEPRKTYHQDWSAYNEAQTHEKDRFQSLLAELCQEINSPKPQTVGRPRLNLQDVVFCMTFKIYCRMSGRIFISDLREAHRRGYIEKLPHYNSITNYLENPVLTPILEALIAQSARPFVSVEVDFAVDASGFSTSRYGSWFDHKRGKEIKKREYIKCNLMCGVKTNVVVSAEIGSAADTVYLPGLLKRVAGTFNIHEVSADKGYISRKNVEAIIEAGAMPFIMPKTNSQGGGADAWAKMLYYFKFHEKEFLDHYHKRSNVESTFHMIKAKFGAFLFSKSDTGLINEALCKVLCHNIVVLNQEMVTQGIDPTNWGSFQLCGTEPAIGSALAQKPTSDRAATGPAVPGSPAQKGGLIRRGLRMIARLIIQPAQ